MKGMKKQVIIMLILLMIFPVVKSQEINKQGNFYISLNIVKFFMGMPNLELEYSISGKVSVYLFSEVNLFSKRLKERGHPDLVFRTGGRYHFLKSTDTCNDLHIGPYTGFTRTKGITENQYFLGTDLGYRYRFSDSYYLYPRALITYTFGDWQVMPGAELLLGRVL